jgi:WD40 repeat protein
MRTFHGHTGFVQSLAFSPVGSLVATGGSDGRVIVWDTLTGDIVHQEKMDGESIAAVAFSPDGTRVATGSHEGNVRVSFLEHYSDFHPAWEWVEQGRVTAVAFPPDGETLAWSSYSGWTRHRVGFGTGSFEPMPENGETGQLFTLRLSPDGRTVAVAGTGPDILLHDIASPSDPVRLPHGDRQGVWSLAYSPDGRTLAAALAGGVQLWDVAGRRLLDQWKNHDDVTTGVAISSDGSRLLTCSWDRTARVQEFDQVSRRRGGLVGCYDWQIGKLYDVAISPDSTLAVAGGDEGDFVVAWDIE